MSSILLAVGLALGTFVSEDAAGIAIGSLISQGQLTPTLGYSALFLGIWVGDLLLFFLGVFLRPLAEKSTWARRWLDDSRVINAMQWCKQRPGQTILMSRVIPGSRLPVYLGAGFARWSAIHFALWTAVACALWAPLVILAGIGGTTALHQWFPGWPMWSVGAAAVVTVVCLGTCIRTVIQARSRRAVALRWRTWSHHEWWPAWTLYVPILPMAVVLAVRHRCLRAPLMVNPALPDSGLVGESKAAILHRLGAAPVLPWCLLPAASPTNRLARLEQWLHATGHVWPVILKPDVGERGAGVRLIANASAAERWLTDHPRRALAQQFHPGPIEISIFWARHPGRIGKILSLTDKVFPVIVADGINSIADLIAAHPRFRLQSEVFLKRLGARTTMIPEQGTHISLGLAGNHAQGCLFRDGATLITPELSRAVDQWMRASPGINFGRFDIRAQDYRSVATGTGLAVVELNGLSSEPTAIYDPSRPPWFAWKMLVRTWSAAFAIGADEARRGRRAPALSAVWRRIRHEYQKNAVQDLTSD